MDYIELECMIEPFNPTISEILVAELSELGYESFVEQESGVLAYIREDQFQVESLGLMGILSDKEHNINFNHRIIKEENWNETWEKNYFEPIVIDGQCVIRSSFHPDFPDLPYRITIDPRMAFGTGHHETTSLIIKEILTMHFEEKKVADLGCGTGILAILSAMKGAPDVTAIDIDEWSYANTLENIELNNCQFIKVLKGDVGLLKNEKFDVVFANINKNVLLNELPLYSHCMKPGSVLILSGFYQGDFPDIDKKSRENGLELIKQDILNNWMMLKYAKF